MLQTDGAPLIDTETEMIDAAQKLKEEAGPSKDEQVEMVSHLVITHHTSCDWLSSAKVH